MINSTFTWVTHALNPFSQYEDSTVSLTSYIGCAFIALAGTYHIVTSCLSESLETFHKRKGLLDNPLKPIEVDDIISLDLDGLDEKVTLEIRGRELVEFGRKSTRLPPTTLVEKWQKIQGFSKDNLSYYQITFEDAARDVIDLINKFIEDAPDNLSPKAKRRVVLNATRGRLVDFKEFGDYNWEHPPCPDGMDSTKWKEVCDELFPKSKGPWLCRILSALKKKGHIFSFQRIGDTYSVQA